MARQKEIPPYKRGDTPPMAWLRRHLSETGMSLFSISNRALGHSTALYHWLNYGNEPRLGNFVAVLDAIGYEIRIVPKEAGRDAA